MIQKAIQNSHSMTFLSSVHKHQLTNPQQLNREAVQTYTYITLTDRKPCNTQGLHALIQNCYPQYKKIDSYTLNSPLPKSCLVYTV